LGHKITSGSLNVDAYTVDRAMARIDWHNASSYKALALSEKDRSVLDWTLLGKYVDIL
jgi:hypothetical protein